MQKKNKKNNIFFFNYIDIGQKCETHNLLKCHSIVSAMLRMTSAHVIMDVYESSWAVNVLVYERISY